MKPLDIIFALICGRVIGFLVSDFLKTWGVSVGVAYQIIIWLILPFAALLCLWIAQSIGRRFLFVFQAGKHLLVGAAATVVDLKIFELIVWFSGLFLMIGPLGAKSISFIFSTLLKYWGNKYWAFLQHEKEQMHLEMAKFFLITLAGLGIDLGAFYYATDVIGPRGSIPAVLWVKFSVIFAALAAAAWNFICYKFLVFKK